ncbi:metallophosphoesterase family protein [Paenibacillus sp. GYB004]|uniref:metallophosphoesterase family protein n=1 Tax=Paenibacillus sp. GYB004 TaxID=2994393 RepID=UPI002F962A1D
MEPGTGRSGCVAARSADRLYVEGCAAPACKRPMRGREGERLKALVLSDVHANIYALEAVWSKENDSDIVYCAGDLVDYGPFPGEVIAWMREHHAVCVQGNHDRKVAALYRQPNQLKDTPAGEWKWKHDNAGKLGEDDITFLERLPESVSFWMDGFGYRMQHLYYKYETIESLYQFNEYWQSHAEEDVREAEHRRLIFGHTHRRAVHYLGDRELWLNPGSVSYRRKDDPSKDAHYMTITDGRIEMKSVEYDRSPLLAATKATRLCAGELEAGLRFFG